MKEITIKNTDNFIDYFSDIEDPRSSRNRLYTLPEILFTSLCAAICGAEGWEDVENFGKAKLNFLRKYLPYKNEIPSDDTIRRFFRAINPEIFKKCFISWVKSFQKIPDSSVIAIDGKVSRHSFDSDKDPLHMVSAFASEFNIVLGQEKVSDKSNEITAIPKLLKLLDIKNNIITIDAMGCQYEIADNIVRKEGNYILALKGNQSNLHDDVKLFFEDVNLLADSEVDTYENVDKGHGRIETRTCSVINDVNWLIKRNPKWKSIKSMIRIESTREIKNKITKETRYFISSLASGAKKILRSIRSHWGIENSLHWVLDMSFNEDQCRIRKENAPHNMAI